jgi:SHS2 domain-containing protein
MGLSRTCVSASTVAHRTFDFSSDVGIEADGNSLEEALVGLGRAMAQVLTDGSRIEARDERAVRVDGTRDWPGTAVAWINELVFLFDTDQFLIADGELSTRTDADGIHHIQGTVRGERFDPNRHGAGRGVKAATFHDATYEDRPGHHRLRLILDL